VVRTRVWVNLSRRTRTAEVVGISVLIMYELVSF